MCIIVCKNKGVVMPSKEVLKNCWDNNNDGAGLAYYDGKQVVIKKGFMSWQDLEATLDKLGVMYDLQKLPMVFHFRISTHGGINASNTHPFPISSNIKSLRKLTSKTDVAVAMNGIVSAVDLPFKETYSDTMAMIADDFSYLQKLDKNFYKRADFKEYIAKKGAKWAFLDDKGITTFGEFNTIEGVQYSNYSYIKRDYSMYYSTKDSYIDTWLPDDVFNRLKYSKADGISAGYMDNIGVEFSGQVLIGNIWYHIGEIDGLYYDYDNNVFFFYDVNTFDIYIISNITDYKYD